MRLEQYARESADAFVLIGDHSALRVARSTVLKGLLW
jgi:hypothetical protein